MLLSQYITLAICFFLCVFYSAMVWILAYHSVLGKQIEERIDGWIGVTEVFLDSIGNLHIKEIFCFFK